MELLETIEKRKSVRNFLPEPVPVDSLREMVRRAGLAPSVNNYQPWKFFTITNKDLLNRMAETVSKAISELPANESRMAETIKSQVEWFSTFFRDAPALIAMAMEEYETILEKGVRLSHEDINRLRNFPDIQSAGACVQTILLSAVDLGYGACWLSGPMVAREKLEGLLGIEQPFHLVSFIAIGKPAKDPAPKRKKSLDEIIRVLE